MAIGIVKVSGDFVQFGGMDRGAVKAIGKIKKDCQITSNGVPVVDS